MLKHSIRYPQKLSIIEAIPSYLIGQRENISIAYLFGSFINDESFSDIDLGVLTERELERPRRYLAEVVNAPVCPGKNGKASFRAQEEHWPSSRVRI